MVVPCEADRGQAGRVGGLIKSTPDRRLPDRNQPESSIERRQTGGPQNRTALVIRQFTGVSQAQSTHEYTNRVDLTFETADRVVAEINATSLLEKTSTRLTPTLLASISKR